MAKEFIIPSPLSQTSLPSMDSKDICQHESQCSKPAYFSCHHCSKPLCLEHIRQHNTLNLERADDLSCELDSFVGIISNFEIQNSCQNARIKLDTWKTQMLNNIQSIYESHLNEINCLEKELNHRLNIYKEQLTSKVSNLQTQLLTIRPKNEISKQVIL